MKMAVRRSRITGKPLSGICYDSPVASAQVKSAILLAGLYAEGEPRVTEPRSPGTIRS